LFLLLLFSFFKLVKDLLLASLLSSLAFSSLSSQSTLCHTSASHCSRYCSPSLLLILSLLFPGDSTLLSFCRNSPVSTL
jgi:hypothetical protein